MEFMDKGSLRDIIANGVPVPLALKFHWALSIIKGLINIIITIIITIIFIYTYNIMCTKNTDNSINA